MAVSQAALRRRTRIMRVVNVPMRAALSLPFATPLSANLMLISYTGRKSGKAYRQPVSYVRDGDVLLTPGGGRWTLNLAGGRPARIRLRGRDQPARPELVTDPAELERLLAVITDKNPRAARFIPIPRRPDGRPDPDALDAALRHGFCIVRWHQASPPPAQPVQPVRPGLVGAGLVPSVGPSFQLERRVLDIEVPGQARLELVEQPRSMAIKEAGFVHDDVRGQGRQAGGDGPGVQVVHVVDMLGFEHVRANPVQVHVLRCRLQQDPPGIAEQVPRGHAHEPDDDQRRDRVGAGKPRRHDHDSGYDRADEAVQVGQHVPERALNVQARPVRAGQHPRGGDVDDDPGAGHGDHRAAVHGGRMDQPADRLDGHDSGDHQQRDSVAGGGQDLGPLPPERPGTPGWPCRQPDRPQRTAVAPTSASMCPASDSSASDPDSTATTTSDSMKPASRASAASRYRRSESGFGPCECTAP